MDNRFIGQVGIESSIFQRVEHKGQPRSSEPTNVNCLHLLFFSLIFLIYLEVLACVETKQKDKSTYYFF